MARSPSFDAFFNPKRSKQKSVLVRIDQEFKEYLNEAYGYWFKKNNNESFREFTRKLAKRMPRPKDIV